MALTLAVGVVGNALVLFIYLKKFKTYSEGRFLISVLAAVDAIATIVNCSYHINDTMLMLRFNGDIECKMTWFLGLIATLTSAFVLLLIAIDRYLKVCKPFGGQLTMRRKKMALCACVLISLILSAPSILFRGTATIESKEDSLVGKICTSVSSGLPTISLAYFALLLFFLGAGVMTLSVLYFLICFMNHKFDSRGKSTTTENNYKSQSDSNSTTNQTRFYVSEDDVSENNELELKSLQTEDATTPTLKMHSSKRMAPRTRLTLVFLIMTITYTIAYIPKTVILILNTVNPNFFFTDMEYGLTLRLLRCSYILCYIASPFIYGLMDKRFQPELKKLCCKRI